MVFYSKITKMQFTGIRKERHDRHPVTGDIIKTYPKIDVMFGEGGSEFTYRDPDTGREETGAEIRGHFFDTEEWQREGNGTPEGWTDEDREQVERYLMRKCDEVPEWISLHSDAPVDAPWPTYDTLGNYLEIASLAEKLGLLDQALTYERQNKNRDGVVKALMEKKTEQEADAELVAH
jgi:hypothetical protein